MRRQASGFSEAPRVPEDSTTAKTQAYPHSTCTCNLLDLSRHCAGRTLFSTDHSFCRAVLAVQMLICLHRQRRHPKHILEPGVQHNPTNQGQLSLAVDYGPRWACCCMQYGLPLPWLAGRIDHVTAHCRRTWLLIRPESRPWRVRLALDRSTWRSICDVSEVLRCWRYVDGHVDEVEAAVTS